MKKFLFFFLSIAGLAAPLAADCGSCCEPYCGSCSCYPSGCCDDPCCTWWDGGEEPWGGFYAGVFGGYGWGRVKASSTPSSSLLNSHLDIRGGLVGALIGWNYQWCDWVAGFEADFAWCNLKKNSSNSIDLGTSEVPIIITDTVSAHQRLLGTVRLRLGYNWCDTLLYATGGLAYGNAKYEVIATATVSDVTLTSALSGTRNRAGWTVGGGIEKMLWCNWSVKLEYLYYNFGRTHLSSTSFREDWKNQIHTVKAGINYHF